MERQRNSSPVLPNVGDKYDHPTGTYVVDWVCECEDGKTCLGLCGDGITNSPSSPVRCCLPGGGGTGRMNRPHNPRQNAAKTGENEMNTNEMTVDYEERLVAGRVLSQARFRGYLAGEEAYTSPSMTFRKWGGGTVVAGDEWAASPGVEVGKALDLLRFAWSQGERDGHRLNAIAKIYAS